MVRANRKSQKNKLKYFEDFIQECLPEGFSLSKDSASLLLKTFVSITPPLEEEESKLLSIPKSGKKGGTSKKMGNIFCNWQKLIDIIPDATIAGVGAASSPIWLWPLIGLYIWNKVSQGQVETFSQREAMVIFVLWKNSDAENKISEEVGFNKAVQCFSTEKENPLEKEEFCEILEKLTSMKCLELTNGEIKLQESLAAEYS